MKLFKRRDKKKEMLQFGDVVELDGIKFRVNHFTYRHDGKARLTIDLLEVRK
jgi:hypothetical protein